MRSGWEAYEEASVLPGSHNRKLLYQTTVMVVTDRVGVGSHDRTHHDAPHRASVKVITDRRRPTPHPRVERGPPAYSLTPVALDPSRAYTSNVSTCLAG